MLGCHTPTPTPSIAQIPIFLFFPPFSEEVNHAVRNEPYVKSFWVVLGFLGNGSGIMRQKRQDALNGRFSWIVNQEA